MAEKTVTYFFPIESNPSVLKMFQDQSSQVRCFYFKRNYLNKMKEMPNSENNAIYFLFGNNRENGKQSVYIGKSPNGYNRLSEHRYYKEFWSYGMMFVSDNESFDANIIDYMEYYFSNKVKEGGSFSLENRELREKEPNLSVYNKTICKKIINEIEFLLKAEGVSFEQIEMTNTKKYYSPYQKSYNAKIFVQDGRFFLEKGSIIQTYRGREETKVTEKSIKVELEKLLRDEKIKQIDNNKFEVLVPLSYEKPSRIGILITGRSCNGWRFFENIEELRTNNTIEDQKNNL